MADLNELKPINYVLNLINKFCFTIGMIPTSYKMSITYEEQILAIGHYLETVVYPAINNNAEATAELQSLYIDLKNYVDNYFDDLDVQEEINNKLDEMAENGTLSEIIINNILSKETPQTMNNLDLLRIMRTLERNSLNPDYNSNTDFPILQGGTYTGNNKMVIARIKSNNSNEVLLQEISLLNGLVLRENTFQFNHANSLTFNPNTNEIFVTSLFERINNIQTQLHFIYVVDYVNFTLKNTLDLTSLSNDEGVHSISYDIVKNKYYIATENLAENNSATIYELNINTLELTKIDLEDYSNTLNFGYNNDILVYNGFIYFLKYNPQIILCFNIQTKKLFNVYNIENTFKGQPIRELENISIKYDEESLDLIIVSNGAECVAGFYNMFQYFKANVFRNMETDIKTNMSYFTRESLFVDINSSSLNPDGTQNNKFKTINEALQFAQHLNGVVTIYVSAGTYPYVNYNGNKGQIDIRPISNENDVIIQGMKLTGGKFFLTQLSIENMLNSQNYDLQCDFVDLRMSLINFLSDIDYNVFVRRCNVDFFNITYQNTLFYCQTDTTLICHDNEPTYNFANQKPAINKPIKLSANVNTTKIRANVSTNQGFNITQNGNIKILYYAHTCRGFIEFQHAQETQRNFSFNIDRYFYKVAMFFDYTNNQIGFQILEAYLLNTNGTVTNILDTESVLLIPYIN